MTEIIYSLIFFSAVCNAQSFSVFNVSNSGLLSNHVNAIFINQNDVKWFGTKLGLSILHEPEWDSLTTDDGLASNIISDIIGGKDSIEIAPLWVTTTAGISKLSFVNGKVIVSSAIKEDNSGLIANDVRCCAIAEDINLQWFGTVAGCSSFDGSNWASFSLENYYLYSNIVNAISAPKDDWTYIATNGGGVARIKQEGIDAITSASIITTDWHDIASDTVYSLFIDKAGNRWFGTDKGISKHFGDDSRINWEHYTVADGLINNHVLSICEDSAGMLWFGTQAGLSSFNGEIWKNYTVENGLSGNVIFDLAVDKNDGIWIATDKGVTHLKKNTTAISSKKSAQNEMSIILNTFPNPFIHSTVINFTLPTSQNAVLSVYNMLGEKVAELVNGNMSAGYHTVTFDAAGLSSGIYVYRISAGNYVLSKKMLILK